MLKTQLYRSLIFLIGQLPLGMLRALGTVLGTLAWFSRSRMSLVTRQNIELCYPNLDSHRQKVLSKQSLQETGKTMAETCFAWTRSPESVVTKIHEVQGLAEVDQANNDGHGIVFVIPHQGNWEIINHYLGHHYGLTHMFQPNRNKNLNNFIQSKRQLTGTQFVPTDKSGIKAQLKILRSGGCIGVMPDQEPLVHTGDFAPFFNVPALSNELVKGYQRSGCKFFVAVCERDDRGFVVKLDEVPPSSPAETLTATNLAMEQAIRRRPEQYLWSYKRFRTRPEGELDYYHIDQHPAKSRFESLLLGCYHNLFATFPIAFTTRLSRVVSLLLRRQRKITLINLKLTNHDQSLTKSSLFHLAQSALEAPKIWGSKPDDLTKLISREQFDAKQLANGGIVLTPPLGSREFLMRYLSENRQITEYYHSNSTRSLDQYIRTKRTGLGIRLVEHDEMGRSYLETLLTQGGIVTLCPDQQPRLRGGRFIDFFGQPALTTLTLPQLLKSTECPLFIGFTLRESDQFSPNLLHIPYEVSATDEQLLELVNRTLMEIIEQTPNQYRWSDKRFNIQPLGHKKVYR